MTIETVSDAASNSATIQRVTWIGFIINLLLSVTKFLAGIFGNSQVLIADAVHSTSDLATDVAVLVGSRYWGQPADDSHPHGHAKLETLITFIIGAVLGLVGLELMSNAIQTLDDMIFHKKAAQIPNGFALAAAVLSIILKEWLFRITAAAGKKTHSTATVANAWHHRSDALSSIPAALAVGGILIFGEHFAFLDPLGTVVVGFLILYTAFEIIRPTCGTLLDASGGERLTEEIKSLALSVEGVQSVHKIRTRPLGNALYGVDLHVMVNPEMVVRQAHHISHIIQDRLKEQLPQIVEATVHIEPGNTKCASEPAVSEVKK